MVDKVLPALHVAVRKAALCTYLEPLQDHNWCCWAWTDQVEPSCLDTGHLRRKDNSSVRHAVNQNVMLFWEHRVGKDNCSNTFICDFTRCRWKSDDVLVFSYKKQSETLSGVRWKRCEVLDCFRKWWNHWIHRLWTDMWSEVNLRRQTDPPLISPVWCLGSEARGWRVAIEEQEAHPQAQEAVTVLYFNTDIF